MRRYEPPASFAALHSRPPFAPLRYTKRGEWRLSTINTEVDV